MSDQQDVISDYETVDRIRKHFEAKLLKRLKERIQAMKHTRKKTYAEKTTEIERRGFSDCHSEVIELLLTEEERLDG